jgi:succinate dehydrogenase / fumarate reductase cytochrome b subunit
MIIVMRGKRNVADYPYEGNIRYTLQRATGVIAFLFILYHVFQMHGWIRAEWWRELIAPWGGARFRPSDALTAAEVLQSSALVQAVYALGVLSCVYHFANGVWTTGITWGVWTSPRAQRLANFLAAGAGIFLAVVGIGALIGMATVDASAPPDPRGGPVAVSSHTPHGLLPTEKGSDR